MLIGYFLGTLIGASTPEPRSENVHGMPQASKNHLLQTMSDRIAVLEDALLVQCEDNHTLLSSEHLQIRRVNVGDAAREEDRVEGSAERQGVMLLERGNSQNFLGYAGVEVNTSNHPALFSLTTA